MAKIKYMGSADIRRIEKGERFGGRLAEGTSKDVEWSRENGFVVDTDDFGLSADAVSLLLSEPDFKDVTDASRIPVSLNEKIFGGLSDPVTTDEVAASAVDTEPVTGKKSGTAGGAGGGGTTRGGSTGGAG